VAKKGRCSSAYVEGVVVWKKTTVENCLLLDGMQPWVYTGSVCNRVKVAVDALAAAEREMDVETRRRL
jgi:hypothetical protein